MVIFMPTSSPESELAQQQEQWLDNVEPDALHGPARAIIAPHAGYSYSGKYAAYAYRQVSLSTPL